MVHVSDAKDENHDILNALRKSVRDEPESGIVNAANYVWKLGREAIPMWVGEGSEPTPEFICRAAVDALARGETFYTHQRGIPELRNALASYHERHYGKPFDAENFYVTVGGMGAIQIAVQAVAEAGSEIVIPSPAWPNYAAPMRMHQVTPVEVPMRFANGTWHIDLDRLLGAVTDKTRAIAINSPSNPVGSVVGDEELIAIRDFCRNKGIWIIADEVYHRFFYPVKPGAGAIAPSFQNHCDAEEQVIYVNTFSKNWAMTGWRMGWMQAPQAMGQKIENLIQYNTSGVPSFMQPAGVTALNEGEDFVAKQVAHCKEGLDIVLSTLGRRNDIAYQRPEGAFYYFFKVDGIEDSTAAIRTWIDEIGVGLAPGTAFGPGGESWFRMCYAGAHEDLRTACERLSGWLDRR
ncbi:MAG: pyridoxal phosphate-dependent aminotransferase [Hyphomicrobiales bacterium]